MPVNFEHPGLVSMRNSYRLIGHCIEGEESIKREADRYLPRPNEADRSREALARYENYRKRAVFYNVTDRTLKGLVGQLFLRAPVVEKPDALDVLDTDADGSGVPLVQMAQRAAGYVCSKGRAGLLVDFPIQYDAQNQIVERTDALSMSQVKDANLHPIWTVYQPEDIINWRTDVINGERKLILVVLRDRLHAMQMDGFGTREYLQYKVLRLDQSTGNHVVEIHNDLSGTLSPKGSFTPLSFNGAPLDTIPFTFIGSENNDTLVDKPPMLDIANLNIAHYRNSADYEESCFRVGQPTVWVSGVDDDFIQNVWKGAVVLGSNNLLTVPKEGEAGILSVPPNSMPREAMQDKELQMMALGAKLVISGNVQKTATQTVIEQTSESSVLAQIAKNIGSAFEAGLKWSCGFMNIESDMTELKYELNQDFDFTSMDANTFTAIQAAASAGYLSWSEVRDISRRLGYATLDDADAKAEIDKDQQDKQDIADQNAQRQMAVNASKPAQVVAPVQQPGDGRPPVGGKTPSQKNESATTS